MSKMKARIVYESLSRVFTPGQKVAGNVLLEIKEEVLIKSIVLFVIGKSYTNWCCDIHFINHYNKATKKQEKIPETHQIRGNELYIDDRCVLFEHSTGENLTTGTHKFDFAFPLPFNCPPSYEGQVGYIRYYCKVKIVIPKRPDKSIISGFTVLPPFDLNSIHYASSPVIKEETKNIGFIVKHGKVKIKARIQKFGFVPGEYIDIRIDANNKSLTRISTVEAKLLENSDYEGYCSHYSRHQGKKKYTRTIEKELNIGARKSGFDNLAIRIPSIVPSFNNCRIIQVNYTLKVKIDADGYVNNTIDFDFPILIGTIPIDNTLTSGLSQRTSSISTSSSFLDTNQDSNNRWLTTPLPSFISSFEPPPSYEDSMFGRNNMAFDEDDNASCESSFAPRYPFYNNTRFRSSSGCSLPPISSGHF